MSFITTNPDFVFALSEWIGIIKPQTPLSVTNILNRNAWVQVDYSSHPHPDIYSNLQSIKNPNNSIDCWLAKQYWMMKKEKGVCKEVYICVKRNILCKLWVKKHIAIPEMIKCAFCAKLTNISVYFIHFTLS